MLLLTTALAFTAVGLLVGVVGSVAWRDLAQINPGLLVPVLVGLAFYVAWVASLLRRLSALEQGSS